MATATHTHTETQTITAGDVRKVMSDVSTEISHLLDRLSHLSPDFDVNSALVDLSLLALNDVITAIHLQFYLQGKLIREYRYDLSGATLQAFGPPPHEVPLGFLPADARVRLTVTPNAALPSEVRKGWFQRLGWMDADPLILPKGVDYQTYGTFVSGGFGVERRLLIHPDYDAPLDLQSGTPSLLKKGSIE